MNGSYAPNFRLRGLLAEAGWTGQALARAVNALGAEAGLRLRYDRASVAHWLAGTRPRPPVPGLIVEALSRHLGRPLTPATVGFGGYAYADAVTDGDALIGLLELAKDGADPRLLRERFVYHLTGLAVPAWDRVRAVRSRSSPPGVSRVGATELASVDAMATMFAEADAAFGGTRVRGPLAAYLATTVVPWLREGSTTATVQQRLFAASSRLAYLCGFMCFDDELQGPAQRYYLSALQLSAEVGDALGYAIALRGLSVQAHSLGHRGESFQLAEYALSAAPAYTPALTRAFLLGQSAVAAAGVGEKRTAFERLSQTERQLSRSSRDPVPIGAYNEASLAHQTAVTHALLGQRAKAIETLSASIRYRPVGERRSRMITLARLAELRLDLGHLEHAVVDWHSFLDDYPQVRSGRGRTALRTMRARLRSHQRNPLVGALLRRARDLHSGPSIPD